MLHLFSGPQKKFRVCIGFYLFVVVSLTTGLIIELGPKQFKEPVEEIHILSIYYLMNFIFLHIGGVLLAEFTHQKVIVSRIVSGNRNKKQE